jgi:hypothetical protein
MNTAPDDLDAELAWLSAVAKYLNAPRRRAADTSVDPAASH